MPHRRRQPVEPELVVPESVIATGDLPRVCVVTGQATENMVAMRWVWAPLWVAVFLATGVLPAFVLRYLLGDRAAGYLPMLPSVRRKYGALTAAGVTGVAVGAMVMVAGFSSGTPAVGVLGLVLVALGLYGTGCRRRALAVRRVEPGFLGLGKAHPTFAEAFLAGRPGGQEPYSVTPLRFGIGRVFASLGATFAALLVSMSLLVSAAASNAAEQAAQWKADNCFTHPAGQAAVTEFARASHEDLLTGSVDSPIYMTPPEVKAAIANNQRSSAVLAALPLNRPDRFNMNKYLAALGRYDDLLLPLVKHPTKAANSAAIHAGVVTILAWDKTDASLMFEPFGCPQVNYTVPNG